MNLMRIRNPAADIIRQSLSETWKPVQARIHQGQLQLKIPMRSNPVPIHRNVAAGEYDDEGIFHPFRASWDYDPSWVGEKYTYAPKKRSRKKTRKGRKR
jgi:hypothetical protein